MSPTEALGAAFLTAIPDETWESTYPFISVTAEFTDAILDALAADGWTVARTQDARDGEALRLLREALPEGFDCEVTFMQGDVWEVSVYDGPDVVAQFTEATIAAAADACRADLEATR